MWELALYTSLSIFLTCTFFFVIYGLAYLGVKWTIYLVKKLSKEIKDENK
tara:strand:+ start:2299 stop:2448 length:150 start_codon:yes stop_codon:yes gene_type:complete